MSLDKSAPPQEPVRDVEELVAYFRAGEKPREAFRVGMEHEKIGLRAGTFDPIPYAGPRGIGELLRRLPRFGYELFLEGETPIAATHGPLAVTLEPGGQLELSGRPFECLHDLDRELRRHLALGRALASELGHVWLGVGYRPWGSPASAEWMPKGRYARMREKLSRTGAYGLDMMTMTATVQASFDYADEADMARLLRGATAVSPLVAALFANSPLRDGKESGLLSMRTEVWRAVDPARCGPLAAAFEPGFGYRAYADWALDVPMIFLRRPARRRPSEAPTSGVGARGPSEDASASERPDGPPASSAEYRDPRGLTFRRFLAEGLDGERATISDWEDHLTTLFPEVRLKRVIEMRSADMGSRDMCVALPTLWKGIVYDRDALAAAEQLVPLPFSERLALQGEVARHALRAKAGRHLALELCRELVEIADAGLRRQGRCGADETRFLAPLRELLERGKCPAEIALDRLHGEYHGDAGRLVEHWRVA